MRAYTYTHRSREVVLAAVDRSTVFQRQIKKGFGLRAYVLFSSFFHDIIASASESVSSSRLNFGLIGGDEEQGG